jgi:hypothetical protein
MEAIVSLDGKVSQCGISCQDIFFGLVGLGKEMVPLVRIGVM